MLQHYLLITLRNLKRHKGSFVINLVGLTAGLACTFLIYLWVNDELHFDTFHKKELYQVLETNTENGTIQVHDGVQGPLPAAMKRDLPEVADAVGVLSLKHENIFLPIKSGDKVVKSTGLWATRSFFNMFSFPLLQGQPAQVLAQQHSIVISQEMARQLFGAVDKAVGKQISWELFGNKTDAMVTGVLGDIPSNSSLQFDFVLSLDFDGAIDKHWGEWKNTGPATYIQLKEGTDINTFQAKIRNYLSGFPAGGAYTLFTRPFSSAYLHGNYENGVQTGGRIVYVRLFSLIAIFLLAIACINFMNLSTARASRRLKEVGVKKAIGASRASLIIQFMTEAICMTLLSFILSVIVVALVLPQFNILTGKDLSIRFSPQLIAVAGSIALLTGFVAGSYPACYLSGFDPVRVLKGRIKTQLSELLARKGLVIFQFTISLVLIVAVVVVYRQVDYIQSKNIGYNKENVIYFDQDGNIGEPFLAAVKQLPGVVNAGTIQGGMLSTEQHSATFDIRWPGKNEKEVVNFIVRQSGYDLIETLGLQLKEGRSFSRRFGGENNKVIFNETAIKAMGLKDPVGKEVIFWGEPCTIIGVVKDFHMSSLHDPIEPMVFGFEPGNTNTVMIKIRGDRMPATIASIERLYKQFNSGYLFTYKFLDASYKAQYISERRVATLSRYFAGLAILISCLGLFGLAAFNAEIRTKEIGIRKIMGATASNIVLLLSKDFMILVFLAILFAFPLSWWLMSQWLNNYAYHIYIGSSVFIIAGISVIGIAMLTIAYQSLKAAMMDPVKSIKSE
jgi:ABC-type antimicrobial peptide transport system permease subunit